MLTINDIQKFIEKKRPKIVLKNQTKLTEIAFDSLDIIEMIVFIEKNYNKKIKIDDFTENMTVKNLLDLLNSK